MASLVALAEGTDASHPVNNTAGPAGDESPHCPGERDFDNAAKEQKRAAAFRKNIGEGPVCLRLGIWDLKGNHGLAQGDEGLVVI